MDDQTLLFFHSHPQALPLYEALETKLKNNISPLEIKVQKSQISFYHKRLFGCVSFLRPKKGISYAPGFLTLTFGLGHPLSSSRIAAVIEPYPNRWTHHLLLDDETQLDEELMAWLTEAADFAAAK